MEIEKLERYGNGDVANLMIDKINELVEVVNSLNGDMTEIFNKVDAQKSCSEYSHLTQKESDNLREMYKSCSEPKHPNLFCNYRGKPVGCPGCICLKPIEQSDTLESVIKLHDRNYCAESYAKDLAQEIRKWQREWIEGILNKLHQYGQYDGNGLVELAEVKKGLLDDQRK